MTQTAPTAGEPSRRERLGRIATFATVGAGALVLDAATKAAMLRGGGPVELPFGIALRLAHNTGAAFSMGTGLTPLFALFAAFVVIGLSWYAARVTHRGWLLVFGLIAGGAAGNLYDRLVRPPGFGQGAVTDWIDLGWWPVFNLADTFLCLGVATALWLSWRKIPTTTKAESAQGNPG